MRQKTDARGADSADELWLLEHRPIYTLGRAGRRIHVHEPGAVPVVRSDRGGQVTYHGPGQLVGYVLFDLRRARLGVRRFVNRLEQAVIDALGSAALEAGRLEGAPGVYVGGRKIASLGLRVRNGCTFHGVSINVDLDLAPFSRIDTCGFDALPVTSLADEAVPWTVEETGRQLAASLGRVLGCGVEWEDSGNRTVGP